MRVAPSEPQSVSTAPYGTWDSPITLEQLTRKQTVIGELALSDAGLYYTETRPDEQGHTALMHLPHGGEPSELVDRSAGNIVSQVHEYGGGSFALLADASPIFAHVKDGHHCVSMQRAGQTVTVMPSSASIRYADFSVNPQNDELVAAVQEEHKGDRADEVFNRLVCLDLGRCREGRPAHIAVLSSDHDFYAYPRFSNDGRMVAWVTWNHPDMPFWNTELRVAGIARSADGEIRLSRAHRMGCGPGGNVVFQQPSWIPQSSPVLAFTRTDAESAELAEVGFSWDGQLDSAPVANHMQPIAEPDATSEYCDVQPPLWDLNASSYVALDSRYVLCAETERAFDQLILLDRHRRARIKLKSPYTHFAQLRAAGGKVAMIAGSGTVLPAVVVAAVEDVIHSYTVAPASLKPPGEDEEQISREYLSEPMPVTFPTRGRDGRHATGHALVFSPRNPRFRGPDATKPPCRMLAHGGPTSSISATLNLSIQYWTSRGWLVCAVNYRGSTGYGHRYMEELNGEWGEIDPRDCAAAATYLAGQSAGRETVVQTSTFDLHCERYADRSVQLTVWRTEQRLALTLTLSLAAGALALGCRHLLALAFGAVLPSRILLAFSATTMALCIRIFGRVQAESICVMPGMGVQLETIRGACIPRPLRYLFRGRSILQWRRERRFIPRDTILDCFVVEAIHRWSIRDYVAIATDNHSHADSKRQDSLQVIFPHLLPPHALVAETFRRIHAAVVKPYADTAGDDFYGSVNRNLICITGASAGGLTVLRSLSLYPDLFCAGTSSYGVCDLRHLAHFTHKLYAGPFHYALTPANRTTSRGFSEARCKRYPQHTKTARL